MTTVVASLAVLAGGLLAGLSVDRTVVAMPAWRGLDVEAWAAFSRRADLGRGLVVYPALGIAGPVLSIAAAAAFAIGGGPTAAALPLALAALLSVGHLAATGRAAPVLMSLRQPLSRPELEAAFVRFERVHAVRSALQVLTFGANVWALVALLP